MLACLSGPDIGKRFTVDQQQVVVGRSPECNLLSDDPSVAERHVIFILHDNGVNFSVIDGSVVFVDGRRIEGGKLDAKQQIRIGRSLWHVAQGQPQNLSEWLDNVGGRISTAAGVEKIQGFSLLDMFSEVFGRHTDEEMEEYFSVGTATTTPPLLAVNASWPKPWAFLRMFGFSALIYAAFVFALREFHNPLLIPGLIMVGSFLIPFSILVFFFEVNVARNVPPYQLVKLVMLGGILSLMLSLFIFRITNLSSWLGAASAGIVEEIGKTAALFLVINKVKYRWTLNGMLFGAAVGTGFASFESAGYAFYYGLYQSGTTGMMDIITLRGFLSIVGGHVLWTAAVGAALWKVRGDRKFRPDMLGDARFLRVFGFAVAMHMVWNSPVNLPFYAKQIALGFVAWVIILSYIQDGLKQIREEQSAVMANQ
jgi:RsiW-degrading membrane proteinase PrsW (M82 family)